LVIHGGALAGGEVSSWGDHRIAMAAAIAATVCAGPVIIKDAEAVNKSYPLFFKDLQDLGGKVKIVSSEQ
jgi:3-phosphoshikimate 1-carboxyvinyltransferase